MSVSSDFSMLEIMGDGHPCADPCDVCLLFGPLTPETMARIRDQVRPARRCYAEGCPDPGASYYARGRCRRCYLRELQARRQERMRREAVS